MPRAPNTTPSPREPDGTGQRRDTGPLTPVARERARAVRGASMIGLAALGLPLWLVANWPARFPPQLRLLTAGAWALAAIVVLARLARHR